LITPWHWLAFAAFVVTMLVLDLGVFHRHSRETSMREAGIWTTVWFVLAMIFNGLLWRWQGPVAAYEFLTGYLVEWCLSMDNVFVFAVIFGYFRVPMKYQHRVLFWGILGAVFMRLTFIIVGSEIIAMADWVLPLLGLILIYSGVKLSLHGDAEVHPEKNIILRLARKVFPVSTGEHGNQFFVRENGRVCLTPLFLVLLVVESTDVVFAVDSVPAIFGIVSPGDYFTFVVFTSNVFAILGLRALYFLLAGMMDMFRYLSYGLSAILVFVGLKMLAEYAAHKLHFVAHGQHLVHPLASLVLVISILGVSIVASIISAKREQGNAEPATPETGAEQALDQSPDSSNGAGQRSEQRVPTAADEGNGTS
jgi:tellurite resistance protein TerC